MAYTYNDFINAANSNGVLDRFSQEDLTVAQKSPEYGLSMVSLMKDISGATTAEQRLLATEAANQLRKNYGVYGTDSGYAGSYGSRINDLLGKVNNYGSFNYGGQEAYDKLLGQVGSYGSFNYENQEQLQQAQNQVDNYGSFNYGNETIYQQLLNSVANQQPFSYDPSQDPTHAAYKKAYLREGERASANALAQASAANGGQVSSYAAQAAQQANNYYAGQLADIIPTLEQNAYQRYLSDFESRLGSLSAMQSDRSQAQQEWLNQYNILQNTLSNLQSDRNFSYQKYLDQYSQLQSSLSALQNDRAQEQENWLNQYNILQNNLSNLQQQDATDYQRYLDQAEQQMLADQQAQQEYENALALYQILGYATPEVAEILGLSSGSAGNDSTANHGNAGLVYTGLPGPVIEEENEEEPKSEEERVVTNSSTSEWVVVGNGRVSWPELARMVESGEIIEIENKEKGTVSYKYASTSTTNAKNKGTVKSGGASSNRNTRGGGKDIIQIAMMK